MTHKIVYTSGTFDMFHSNHVKVIQYARGLADTLIVGVSTDEVVSNYKRPPIVPFEERIAVVRALKYPDIVIPQHSLDHTDLVQSLNVDAFVVGDDWRGRYDYLREHGVSVYYFPYGSGVSSSNLKEKVYLEYKRLRETADTHGNPEVTP